MHIPDGYLGPQTYGPFYAVMVPVWYWASRVLKKTLKAKHATYLALGAAFCFIIMMFNIPMPGGSTGHAVGATLVAIILGPWAASISVSIALIIQALLFGDGGITAIAANCFNMAFVMPFAGYYIYRLLGSGSNVASPRKVFAAFIAAYLSLNLAALFAAVEFGIQPLIAHAPDGTPLYAPYPLHVAVPVMVAEHLVLFGFVEGIITALVVAYVARTNPEIMGLSGPSSAAMEGRAVRSRKGLWIGIGILILLAPLGLIARGTAWGEWAAGEVQSMLGFLPEGLRRLEGLWPSLITDYSITGWDSPVKSAFGYIISAIIGVGLIVSIAFLVSRLLSSERRKA